MKTVVLLNVILAALPLLAAAQQGDATKGKQVAETICAACHGPKGDSTNPSYPKLAQQVQQYLVKQLNDYQTGKRKNAIMAGMVANLSPQDMLDVSAYFSAQTLRPVKVKDKEAAQQGEKIYKGGIASTSVPACSSCHGPNGAGIAPQFPRLGGQFADYVETQLKNFKNGSRANDPNQMMRDIAAKLSEKEIKQLAAYVSGL